MKIELPEGFLPPPGVAFSTVKQILMATTLASCDLIKLQVYMGGNEWSAWTGAGSGKPENYRLAPPTPRTVGPFESVHEGSTHTTSTETAWARAMNEAFISGMKRVRIKCTATAEEIL